MMKLVVLSTVMAVALGAYSGDPKLAQILRADADSSPDGSFQTLYETDNGINFQESGVLKQVGNDAAVAVQGAFSWASPEGENVQVQYVADENGYQPQGSHLPTPPPVPEAIVKALAYIAAHPQTEQALAGGGLRRA